MARPMRARITRSVVALLVGFAAVVAACPQARAQQAGPTSAERGRDLAQRLCSSCHLTPGSPVSSVPASVPPLHWIANKPGQTGDAIVLVLIKPHAPMPDLSLTRQEIGDVLSFLETLRTDKGAPALKPPEQLNEKPQFPKPS